MRLCKLPRSMDHRCHLSVTNIPETLLSPASPAGPSPRCWTAILECSGASLSSQHAAPTHRGDAVAVVGSWDLVPSSLRAKRAQLCAIPAHFDFLSVQEEQARLRGAGELLNGLEGPQTSTLQAPAPLVPWDSSPQSSQRARRSSAVEAVLWPFPCTLETWAWQFAG